MSSIGRFKLPIIMAPGWQTWFEVLNIGFIDINDTNTINIGGINYTPAQLVAEDFEDIIVKYDNEAPHHIRMWGVLKSNLIGNLTQYQLDTLHQVFDLWVYWSGEWNDYGVLKENRNFDDITDGDPFETFYELVTDNFNSYSNNNRLHNQPNYDLLINQSEGMSAVNAPFPNVAVRAGSTSYNAAYHNYALQSANQFAGFTVYSLGTTSSRQNGVFVRGNSEDSIIKFYGLGVTDTGNLILIKRISTTVTTLADYSIGISSPNNSVEYTLSIIGNKLRVYGDGILIQTDLLEDYVEDNDITSGRFGLWGNGTNGPLIDNFRAGSLSEDYQTF